MNYTMTIETTPWHATRRKQHVNEGYIQTWVSSLNIAILALGVLL